MMQRKRKIVIKLDGTSQTFKSINAAKRFMREAYPTRPRGDKRRHRPYPDKKVKS